MHGTRRKSSLLQKLAAAAFGRWFAFVDHAGGQFPGEAFECGTKLSHDRDHSIRCARDDGDIVLLSNGVINIGRCASRSMISTQGDMRVVRQLTIFGQATAAVLLGGAGLAALYLRQWPRLVGLCVGFLPVFSTTLHNWVYGHVLVLFSANAVHPDVLVMPPSVYVAAARDLMTLDWHGEHLERFSLQIAHWLSGPAESCATIPLNAAGVAILIYVGARGRQFDPWLRLIGASAMAQHVVALFYTAATARYHFLTWFLTMLVAMVWFQRVAIGWLRRHYPAAFERFAVHPWSQRLASGLDRLQKVSA
jgi:hypothetical protein